MNKLSSVFFAVLLSSALLVGDVAPAHARDCRLDTPLPEDVALMPPGPEVAPDIARFVGAWNGAWADLERGKTKALCNSLVVEQVFANGFARVVYSIGSYLPWNVEAPAYYRAVGRIDDGALSFVSPLRNRLTYRLTDQGLEGTFDHQGQARLVRIDGLDGLGCGDVNVPAAPGERRDRLTVDELNGPGEPADALLHNGYFEPVGAAGPARHAFEGRLVIGAAQVRTTYLGCPAQTVNTPEFVVDFFTVGAALVPAQRDLIRSADPENSTTLMVSPGRVWSEPGDGGWSRAAFPFATGNSRSNLTRNGLATFLYDGERVSRLRFQIVQETGGWARRDYWGHTPLTYQPGPIPHRTDLAARFAKERAAELEIRPWSELAARLDPALADGFAGTWARRHVSAAALVLDGVLYLQPCMTRAGPFPDCRHMRHGVFSVTKTMGAALSLLRLAEKYGPEVFGLKIKDFVQVTADHNGWDDVTFAHALNMAVGVGEKSTERDPPKILPAENSERFFAWLRAPTRKEKLLQAFKFPNYPWGPGEVARYDTTHTFVLAAAMEAFYKTKAGPDADLWDMIQREVLEPVGVFQAPLMRTVETDGSRGTPIFGYGFYPTVEEAAKIAALFHRDGRHAGAQLLYAPKVREAMQRTAIEGLPTGSRNRFGTKHYHLSLWAQPYVSDENCRFMIPHMSGFGGNFVALLPNGMTAIRFSDGWDYEIWPMVRAADAPAELCPHGSSDKPPREPGGIRLTGGELGAAFKGSTLYNAEGWHIYVAGNGRLFGGDGSGRLWHGSWRVDNRGRYCTRYPTWRNGTETCYAVTRTPDHYELVDAQSWSVVTVTVKQGNAEGY